MADIALRKYIEEIDGMIDANRAEEAIAHLKHLLNIYPKHLEAYRLLAKALLEKNRHLDAADVFQRVLSSVPDDFVSHVGMAVVREDEGNVDAAIWHLERAFEVQPNSGPVHEELRRLYGRRDGVEPPRLRLSRAALARMYEKGDLYAQAIAEVRAALSDDPERLDLKVLLASALWRSKQRAEAAETSVKLLEVLPYCKEANRIMAIVWEESGEEIEASSYRRRLEALDPYEAFSDPAHNGLGVMFVAPESVQVERLEYVYGETTTDAQRPDWMEALGIQYDQPTEPAAAPDSADWLQSVTEGGESATTEAVESPAGTDWLSALRGSDSSPAMSMAAEETATDSAPDWLTGMSAASDTIVSESPLAAAAVPDEKDWLSDLLDQPAAEQDTAGLQMNNLTEAVPAAPTKGAPGMTGWLEVVGETPAAPAAEPAADDEVPDWMRGSGPVSMAETSPVEEAPAWTGPAASDQEEGDVPSWLQSSAGLDIPSSAAMTEAAEGDVPDWLKTGAAESPADSAAASEVPDWLQAESQSTAPAEISDQMPDWLRGGAQESEPAASGSDVPDWLRASEPEAPAQAPSSELPDWLSASGQAAPSVTPFEAAPAARMPARTEDAAVQPAASEMPEWLQSGDEALPLPPQADVPDWMAASAAAPAQQSDLPDWLTPTAQAGPAHIDAPAQMPPATTPAASSAAAEADLPDWLRPASEVEPKAAAGKTGITDWLKKRRAAEAGEEALTPEAEAEPAAELAAPQPAPEDIPPWLEPADTAAEVVQGEIPDWLKPGQPEALEPEAVEPEPALMDVEETESMSADEKAVIMARAADEIPDWMADAGWVPRDPTKPLDSPPALEPEAAEPVAEPGDVPAWLQAMKPPEEPRPTPRATGDAPDWLKEAMEGDAPAEPSEAALPDWLNAQATESADTVVSFLKEQPSPAAAAAEPAPDEMSSDEALAWLESLAAKQGAKEDELVTKRSSDLPDWLRKPTEPEEAPAPEEAAPAEPVEAALPDWLRAPAETEPAATASPDWLREPVEPEAPAGTPETVPMSDDAALAWLESLAVRQGANPEELVTTPDDQLQDTEPPAWLPTPTPAEPSLAAQADPAASGQMSDDDALAWLESLAAKQGANPEELVTAPEQRIEETPEWISREQARAAEVMEPAPTMEEPPAPAEAAAPDELQTAPTMSADEALAWLESLAAKQGANPEELVTAPEQRVEETPEWIRHEEEAARMEAQAASEQVESPAAEVADEKPDWLKQMEAEADAYEATVQSPVSTASPAVATADEPEAPAAPTWLSEETADAVVPASAAVPAWLTEETADPAVPDSAAVPAWLTEETADPIVPDSAAIPAWLSEETGDAGPAWEPKHVPPASVPEPEPESVEAELPAWLSTQPAEPETPAWAPAMAAAQPPDPAPISAGPPPQPEAAPKPKATPKTRLPRQKVVRVAKLRRTEAPEIILALARKHMSEAKIDQAIEVYGELVAAGELLGDIISDLEAATPKHPRHVELLRTLGDAYMYDNQLQKALATYKKALRLV